MSQETLALSQKKISPEGIVKLICLVYGAFFIYRTYSEIESLFGLIPNLFDYGLNVLFSLLFLIITPLSLVLLLIKEKGGWILLMFDVISSVPGLLLSNIKLFSGSFNNAGGNASFSQAFVWMILVNTLIYAGVFVGMFRKDVLAMYQISKNNIIAVTIAGLLLFAILYFT